MDLLSLCWRQKPFSYLCYVLCSIILPLSVFLGCSCLCWCCIWGRSSRLLQLLFRGAVAGTITSHWHSNNYLWVCAGRCRRLHTRLIISWQGARIQCFGHSRLTPLIWLLILPVVELPVFALLAPDVPSLIIVFAIILITFGFFLIFRRVLGGSCITFRLNSSDIIFSNCCCSLGCRGCRLDSRSLCFSLDRFFFGAVGLRTWLVLLFIVILALLISLILHDSLLVVGFIGQVRCKGLNRGIMRYHPYQLLLNLVRCDVILRLESHQEL